MACIAAGSPGQDPAGTEDLVARIVGRSPLVRGGFADLAQAVRDASQDHHVALIASHPDDPYLMVAARQRSFGDRVTVILMTRGEGGQNSTGPEVGEPLGRLRTLETEAAAAMLGFEVHYLDLEDAGFCRTQEEALERWGRTKTVESLARAIRSIRPDVLLTTHHPAETHGHDLGLLAALAPAVERAADATWRTRALAPHTVERVFRGTAPNEAPSLVLDMDQVDPVHARTFREQAYEALTTNHRSQSPFRPMTDLFSARIGMVELGSGRSAPAAVGGSLYAGVDTLWSELADRELAKDLIRDIGALSDLISRPRELARRALDIRRALVAVATQDDLSTGARIRLERRLRAIERVILHALGIRVALESRAPSPAIHGTYLDLGLTVHRGDGPVPRANGSDPGEPLRTRWTLRRGIAEFQLFVEQRNGIPIETIDNTVELDWGSPVQLAARLLPQPSTVPIFDPRRYRRTRTFVLPTSIAVEIALPNAPAMQFELELPNDVRPGLELSIEPQAFLVPDGLSSIPFNIRVTRAIGGPDPRSVLDIDTRAGLLVTPPRPRPSLRPPERFWEQLFELRIDDKLDPGLSRLTARLGDQRLLARVARIDCRVPEDLRVGLIQGVDDTTGNVLRSLRGPVDLVLLGPAELPTRDLDDLDTIIVDVRALATDRSAKAAFGRLLEFADGGGRLLVFYHKDTEFNVETSGFRGFPRDSNLHIGRGRVTREDAPVTILRPEHQIFSVPNRIGPADWDGWIQERGLYFPDEWSSDFVPLLEMRDPEQPMERGSLLYARIGSGEYVYCSLALYRQLKKLHPGATRLFLNLIRPLVLRGERR